LSVFTQAALTRLEAQRNAATAAVGAAVPVFELSSDASALGALNGDRAVRAAAKDA
jgi:arginine decarboxylase